MAEDVPMAFDPVGTVEIADRLRVKRGTVDQWRQRGIGFPEPRWTVGGRPAWEWSDVLAWMVDRPGSTYSRAISTRTGATPAAGRSPRGSTTQGGDLRRRR